MKLSDRTKRFFTLAVIVLSAVYGVAIFWGLHDINDKWICGRPNFGSGVIAMVLTLLFYARGIFDFSGRSKWEKLTLLILDILMISSTISLFMDYDSEGVEPFLEQIKESTLKTVLLTVVLTSLLVGARNMALLISIAACLIMIFNSFNLISGAYDFFGFIGLVCYFVAFFLQGTINFRKLSEEIVTLYGKGLKVVGKAAGEVQSIGNTAINIASGRPISMCSENKNEPTIKLSSHRDENNQ